MNEIEKKTYIRLGYLFFIIGSLFGIDFYFKLHFVYKLWPLLIFIQGCGFIIIFKKRRLKEVLYLMLGEYLVLFSFLAFYCSLTSWKKIAHTWPLFITFLGIVLISKSFLIKKSRLVLFAGLFLLLLSVFFFIIILFGIQLWWTIFFLLGLSIIFTIESK